MKRLKFTPLTVAIVASSAWFMARAAPVLAQAGAAPAPALSLDPTQIGLQAGGFGLACYLVVWITRNLETTLKTALAGVAESMTGVKTAIDNNTSAMIRVEEKLDATNRLAQIDRRPPYRTKRTVL